MVEIENKLAKLFIDLEEENWRRIYRILLLVLALFLRCPMPFFFFFCLVFRKSSSLRNLELRKRLKQEISH